MPKKINPTYQHRLFNDDELKLPVHDKIVRWADLAVKENVGIFLDKAGFTTTRDNNGATCVWGDATSDTVSDTLNLYQRQELARSIRRIIDDKIPPMPPPPPVKVERVSWEEILKNDRGTVMGAIDLVAFVKLPVVCLEFSIDRARIGWDSARALAEQHNVLDGPYYVESKNLNVAALDFVTKFSSSQIASDETLVVDGNELFCVREVRWTFNGHDYEYKLLKLAIEAKATVPALGDLIRQMKFYRGHLGGARLFVVAPAEAWPNDAHTILREQGIEAINYQAN